MIRTILQISDMACGMCESHLNNAIRNAFKVKKVSSSHTKNKTEILSERPLDENKLKEVISAAGYTLSGIVSRPYEKKGLFRK